MQGADKNVMDEVRFERLYRSHVGAVEAIVRQFRFRDAAAEDLVQDIFIRAWTKRENLRDVASFSGWLLSIARNACLSALKSQKRLATILNSYHGDESCCRRWSPSIDDGQISLEREFYLIILRQAIECHSHRARAQIARLFYIEEKTVEDIAGCLGMNTNTILSHLYRFRQIVTRTVLRRVANQDIDLGSTRRRLLRA
jgi:RNA polymerase sigma-70 factor (ECF subfamily)